MARCCQSPIGSALWPGIIVSCLLISISLLTCGSLWLYMPQISWEEFISDSYGMSLFLHFGRHCSLLYYLLFPISF